MLTIDIVSHIHALVHLFILMPALRVVVVLLASITSTCAIECRRLLRVYIAPLRRSHVRCNFRCDRLPQSFKDHMSSGLPVVTLLPESLK